MEKDQASQLIAMYGGRFPDYALHSITHSFRIWSILRHPYVWHSQKTRQ